jgi:hypothetical protein
MVSSTLYSYMSLGGGGFKVYPIEILVKGYPPNILARLMYASTPAIEWANLEQLFILWSKRATRLKCKTVKKISVCGDSNIVQSLDFVARPKWK